MDGDHHRLAKRLQMMLSPGKFCTGSNRHNICMVTSAKDLHKLSFKPGVVGYRGVDTFLCNHRLSVIQYYSGPDHGPLFHNKYKMTQDHVIMQCMERELTGEIR